MSRLTEARLAAIETLRAATAYWADSHVRQVERLAGWLYVDLREYHGLGPDEEILLRAAALLHDVGYPVDPERHHKISARIIRSQLGEPFDPEQVELIALLARYHRKVLPKLAHRRYRALDERRRRVVTWLGGILRVADGLDRGHDAAVQFIAVSALEQRLVIEVSEKPAEGPHVGHHEVERRRPATFGNDFAQAGAELPLRVDVRGAQRKSDLLARASGMVVTIRPL